MTESSFETRWHTVQNTWRSNAWLFGVFGYVLGILTLPAVQALTADAMAVLAGLVPETFGIIFTVFIIDRLYRNRETARQREEILKRVIREMRSPSAEEGARAADEARERGFLTDGSLRGANLRGAQLRKANLRGANLAGADLTEAVLAGAMLRGANLHSATLVHADLTA
ncbi:MAG: pentapeptide repeat-containing protein, partial [Chloroflexota bacterium]